MKNKEQTFSLTSTTAILGMTYKKNLLFLVTHLPFGSKDLYIPNGGDFRRIRFTWAQIQKIDRKLKRRGHTRTRGLSAEMLGSSCSSRKAPFNKELLNEVKEKS